MHSVKKKYEQYSEQTLVDFVLYKCRSNDMAFINDFFKSKEFLGPTIEKEFNKFYKDSFIEYDDLLNELYVYFAKDNWRKIEQFGGRTSFIAWIRLISRNFFREFRIKNKIHVNFEDSFDINSPYATITDIKRLLNKINDEKKKNVLKCLYIDRLTKQETLSLLNIYSMSELNKIENQALKAASRIAYNDEILRAIFVTEEETSYKTIEFQEWMVQDDSNWTCEVENEEMKVIIRLIISRWSSIQRRTVIEKRILEGKSSFQTAHEMGLSEGNVYDYLSKGLKQLAIDIKKIQRKI